jgi:hypothetical protein
LVLKLIEGIFATSISIDLDSLAPLAVLCELFVPEQDAENAE